MTDKTMTVGELIEFLSKYPSEYKIRLNVSYPNNDPPPRPGETHVCTPLKAIVEMIDDTIDLCSECKCWSYASIA